MVVADCLVGVLCSLVGGRQQRWLREKAVDRQLHERAKGVSFTPVDGVPRELEVWWEEEILQVD